MRKYKNKVVAVGLGFFAIPVILAAVESSAAEPSTPDARLEVISKEKARFMGFCVSEDGKQEKKLEGVAPAEFQIDMKLYRCQIKPEDKKSSLGVRFFHQRQIVFEKTKPENATSGIEFVIPWGKTKK